VIAKGKGVRYEVTLEPLRMNFLPLLEATRDAPVIDNYRVMALPEMQWITTRPIFDRVRFDAVAYPQFIEGLSARPAELRADVELPTGYNPRALAWAAEVRSSAAYANAKPRQIANMLLQHIRSGGYSYTLAPGEYGHDAIDEFWFDRREGFCEHFAAAFVVMMRAMDVPARVVTGYQGVDAVPLDGYYLVRQSSAHAWAEYWEEGSGWIRADPTAAVAPDRIDRSRRLRPAPGLVAGAIDDVSPELLSRIHDGWDLLNNRWNQWVLSYSRGQQLDLLRNFGIQSPGWEDLALLLIGAFSSLALAGAVWAWWDRRRVDPWVRQMDHLRKALTALGLSAAPHEPPRALAERVRARFGASGEELASLLDSLERQRYSRDTIAKPDAALTRAFVARARGLAAR
jgi:transglutaminase-like putative cysteine protease